MVKLSHNYSRVIALIADLHIGSRYSLCPDKWVLHDPAGQVTGTFMPGEEQAKLLTYWKDYTKIMRNDLKIDSVFVVGDVIAGINPRECGKHMITPDPTEQVEEAIKMLEPLCKNKRVAVWSGTMYHEARDYKIHRNIAEALGGTFFPGVGNIKLTPSERIANVAHHQSAATIYPATPMTRSMIFAKEAQSLGKIHRADVIIRAHKHMWYYIHSAAGHFVSLPCWQSFVPYEKAIKYYFKFQPDIGGAVLFLDERDRIRVWHFTYPAVHISDQTTTI